MRGKWFCGFFLLLLLGGCKDLLNKPLVGSEADISRYQLVGSWEVEEKNTRLELKGTNTPDWFQFMLHESNRLIEGKAKVASFKRKLVFSVDIASVKVNGEPLVREDRQGYLLIGLYYSDEELRFAPASMEKFERNFADYFFAAPIGVDSFCTKTNEVCKSTFTAGNLLYSKERRKFTEDFAKRFRTIFPRRNSTVFVRSGK